MQLLEFSYRFDFGFGWFTICHIEKKLTHKHDTCTLFINGYTILVVYFSLLLPLKAVNCSCLYKTIYGRKFQKKHQNTNIQRHLAPCHCDLIEFQWHKIWIQIDFSIVHPTIKPLRENLKTKNREENLYKIALSFDPNITSISTRNEEKIRISTIVLLALAPYRIVK